MLHIIFLGSCYFRQQGFLVHFRVDNVSIIHSFLAQYLAVGLLFYKSFKEPTFSSIHFLY